ncbi:hypothetical protein HDU81_002782 [Chytriomyces hyalinus]|nr:hypothetical protein HDU81_002782 [Chytriomyces hyalinus]
MTSLEALPIEIIDTLVPMLDIKSLFYLCHCLPHLKPLSKAIFDVSSTILNLDFDRVGCYVWPNLQLGQEYESWPSESYFDSLRSGEATLIQYAKLLNRFGGALDISQCCERRFQCYSHFLPRRIMIRIEMCVTSPDQFTAILRTLSLWKVDVELLRIYSYTGVGVALGTIAERLPHIKGLKTLNVDFPSGFESIPPMVSLQCVIMRNTVRATTKKS